MEIGLKVEWPRNLYSIPVRNNIFSVLRNVQTGSGNYPASYERRLLFPGRSDRSVKLITHLHLVLRLRMTGGIPLLRHMPSWRAQVQPYCFLCHSLPRILRESTTE